MNWSLRWVISQRVHHIDKKHGVLGFGFIPKNHVGLKTQCLDSVKLQARPMAAPAATPK